MTNTTSESGSAQDDAKQAANAVAGDAKSKAVDVQESAKAEVRSVAKDAKDQAADVLGTTRSQLRDQATEQTKNLSATMRDIGDQLGGMADNSEDPEAQVAQLAKSAADTLGARAQRLEDGGLDELVDDVKRFARNRPGAFLLGSIAAGFAVGRLAKHADLQKAGEIAKSEFDTEALKPGDSDSSKDSGSSGKPSSPDAKRVAPAVPPRDMTAGGARR